MRSFRPFPARAAAALLAAAVGVAPGAAAADKDVQRLMVQVAGLQGQLAGLQRAIDDTSREVKRLKDEFGKSVLITDHNVAQTLRVCDRALIINDGRVFAEGTPKKIINDSAVRSAYLGSTFRGDEFD